MTDFTAEHEPTPDQYLVRTLDKGTVVLGMSRFLPNRQRWLEVIESSMDSIGVPVVVSSLEDDNIPA